MIKRKKYFIDKRFQGKMIARVIMLIAGAMVLSVFLSYYISVQMEKKSKVQLYGATDTYQDDIRMVSRMEVIKPIIVRSLMIGGIISIVIATVLMLFYSHRLAGPVYKLRKGLEKMIEGDYGEKLVFRKGDEFQGLAEVINRLQDKLREEKERI